MQCYDTFFGTKSTCVYFNDFVTIVTVSSENKRDRRTIEQVMADNRAKRQKTEHAHSVAGSSDGTAHSEATS